MSNPESILADAHSAEHDNQSIMISVERVQYLVSKHAGAEAVASAALNAIAKLQGNNARSYFTAMSDALVLHIKNSDIVPEREMEHAMIVGPALEEVQRIFTSAIRDLD